MEVFFLGQIIAVESVEEKGRFCVGEKLLRCAILYFSWLRGKLIIKPQLVHLLLLLLLLPLRQQQVLCRVHGLRVAVLTAETHSDDVAATVAAPYVRGHGLKLYTGDRCRGEESRGEWSRVEWSRKEESKLEYLLVV